MSCNRDSLLPFNGGRLPASDEELALVKRRVVAVYIIAQALSLAATLIGFGLGWPRLAAASAIGLGAAALVIGELAITKRRFAFIVRSLRGKARLSTALVGLLLGVSETAFAVEGLTARARLEQAAAEARIWKHDAVLTRVGTTDVKADGKAIVWQYNFQSESSRKCFRVVVVATGMTNTTDLGACTLDKVVGSEFVDSPEAFKGALAGGFKASEPNNMYLAHPRDRQLKPARACWVLFSPKADFDKSKAVMRGWCVDPKSGQFVTRLVGEG